MFTFYEYHREVSGDIVAGLTGRACFPVSTPTAKDASLRCSTVVTAPVPIVIDGAYEARSRSPFHLSINS